MLMQPIGDFYPTEVDAAGEIRVLNRSRADASWPGMADLLEDVHEMYADRLVSVGLRGSWAAGTQVEGVSDVDVYALVEGGDWMRWKNVPRGLGVDLGVATWTVDFAERNPRLAAVLATQGRTVWGKRVAETLPAPRLRDMERHLAWVQADVEAFSGAVAEGIAAEELRIRGRTMVKTLVRAGFECVMLGEGKFATDIYPCMSTFVRHFPEWKEPLLKLVEGLADPAREPAKLVAIARPFACFLEENGPLN